MAKKESSFSGWLQRVRRTGEFSDITVVVEEEQFHLHMLPLLNASSYFRSLPSSSKGYHHNSDSPRMVELPQLAGGAKAFSIAADFCYLIKSAYTLQNIAQIRAMAQFLGMAELLDSTKKYLYMNVFSHWRSSMDFLQQYTRVEPIVDEYIESRCLKVITATCTKAFLDTKYLSIPISLSSSGSSSSWKSSPSQALADIVVRMVTLPDQFVSEVVEELVNGEVNLNLKCRQGRNVKGWLDNTINVECKTDKSRCWLVICLVRMLEKSVTFDRPWLELSSQYWCCLLEHVGSLMKVADPEILEKMKEANAFLEQRIGGSLHELDEYLQTYNFEPQTVLSLVQNFNKVEGISEKEMEEVATEVDCCLWKFVEAARLPASDFISLINVFPKTCRKIHDMLYAAIERMKKRGSLSVEDMQNLWKLVDISRLSPVYREEALNNPDFLNQPHILEYVLQKQSEELLTVGTEDRQKLCHIMQKVIRASLKLLEENSRRSKEIVVLQKQYAALAGSKTHLLRDGHKSSPDLFKSRTNEILTMVVQDEVEEVPSETPARRSICSSVE